MVEQAEGTAVLEEGSSEDRSVFGGRGITKDVVGKEVDYEEEVDIAEMVHGSHRQCVDANCGVL